MPTTTRGKSGFTLASHQSQALCLGTLGISGLLWPIAVWGFSSPLRFLAGWAAAGGGVWLLMKARERWQLHGLEEGVFVAGTSGLGEEVQLTPAALELVHAGLPDEVLENAQYKRLRRVVEEPGPDAARRPRQGWGQITKAKVEDDLLVSYEIATVHSFLTDIQLQKKKTQQLEFLLFEEGSGNRWEITTNPGQDRLVGKLIKDTLPGAIAPEPPDSVVTDREDALRRYADARWILGVDAQGQEVSYRIPDPGGFPHVLVAGGTGGGKSVWARTMIETLRVQGFTCFIASGKDTDFAALVGLPGVAMVAVGPAETAVMVRTVRKEMDRRYRNVNLQMSAGGAKRFDDPPILVLLDEWGTMEMEMRSTYRNSQPFLNDVDTLLRKSRESKIHVVLLSQTIRKTGEGAVPGSWQPNLKLTVSLGRPEPETLKSSAFTPSSRPLAREIGEKMADKAGRGMISERDAVRVTEFQSYYGWSPGTTSLDPGADVTVAPPTEEVRAVWEKWVPVSSSVPQLIPSRGIKASGPEWTDGDLNDVADTPTIRLTDEAGSPIPDRDQYNPRNPLWIGSGGDTDFAGLDRD